MNFKHCVGLPVQGQLCPGVDNEARPWFREPETMPIEVLAFYISSGFLSSVSFEFFREGGEGREREERSVRARERRGREGEDIEDLLITWMAYDCNKLIEFIMLAICSDV